MEKTGLNARSQSLYKLFCLLYRHRISDVGRAFAGGKGFRGRMGIYELMRMSSKIRELTFAAATTGTIRTAAIQEGMSTLYWDGIKKAFKGVTTIDEVMRVAKLQEE